MNILKEWILNLTAVSILVSAALAVCPKGNVKNIVRFTGGLLLLFTLIRPVTELDFETLSFHSMQLRADFEHYEGALIEENSAMVGTIVEEKLRLYIIERAQEYGIVCDASVQTKQRDEGYPYPVSVEIKIRGEPNRAGEKKLASGIEADLGVPAECQTWIYEEERDET